MEDLVSSPPSPSMKDLVSNPPPMEDLVSNQPSMEDLVSIQPAMEASVSIPWTQRLWSSVLDPLNFRPLSPGVQNHLILVYLTLFCALGASAGGAFLHGMIDLPGFPTFFCTFGFVLRVYYTPLSEKRKRLFFLMAAALSAGATVGPIVQFLIGAGFDQSMIVSTFVLATVTCGCFLVLAMIARCWGCLQPIVLLIYVAFMLFLSKRTPPIFGCLGLVSDKVYVALFVFLIYMVTDTKYIIERANKGHLDYIEDSLMLFLDCVEVIARLSVKRMKDAEKGKETRGELMKKANEGERKTEKGGAKRRLWWSHRARSS